MGKAKCLMLGSESLVVQMKTARLTKVCGLYSVHVCRHHQC